MLVEASRPNPLSAEALSERAHNIRIFNANYIREFSTPLYLQNHTDVVPHFSEKIMLKRRYHYMKEYLQGYENSLARPDDHTLSDYFWGRTLLAETVFKTNMSAIMKPIMEREGITLEPAPSSVDISWYEIGPDFQKGVDCLFVSDKKGIMGFDVTIFPKRKAFSTDSRINTDKEAEILCIERKLNHPGVQADKDMPAIIVFLRNITFHEAPSLRNRNYLFYLDNIARKVIVEKGEYPAFYGLSDKDKLGLEKQLLQVNLQGIDRCRETLAEPGVSSIWQHTNRDRVYEKLSAVESWIYEILNTLKS